MQLFDPPTPVHIDGSHDRQEALNLSLGCELHLGRNVSEYGGDARRMLSGVLQFVCNIDRGILTGLFGAFVHAASGLRLTTSRTSVPRASAISHKRARLAAP